MKDNIRVVLKTHLVVKKETTIFFPKMSIFAQFCNFLK